MPYDTYKAPLSFKPAFSLQLGFFIVGLHSGVIFFILLFFPASLVYKVCLVSIVTVSAIYTYRLHVQKKLKHSIQQVTLSVDNQWEVKLAKQAEKTEAILLSSSMINHYLIILNFKLLSGEKCSLIMPSDAVGKPLARKLRARIRVMSL